MEPLEQTLSIEQFECCPHLRQKSTLTHCGCSACYAPCDDKSFQITGPLNTEKDTGARHSLIALVNTPHLSGFRLAVDLIAPRMPPVAADPCHSPRVTLTALCFVPPLPPASWGKDLRFCSLAKCGEAKGCWLGSGILGTHWPEQHVSFHASFIHFITSLDECEGVEEKPCHPETEREEPYSIFSSRGCSCMRG
ncbi:unnamed protein product [Pleuronectes platessa]|uniref:Uncharacterized protein n=1 Tax=Pleuronectes platessa TaxID=8262 RepID=A0A9N7VP77_PLEPL|nr:unnamed protein product [Pleuronectes platessa]